MEDSINSAYLDSLLTEMQTNNEETAAQNEKLDQLIEYLIAKDKKQEKEAQEAQEVKKSQEEEETKEAQVKAESDAQQTETYQELLVEIRDQQDFGNQISAINGVYIGIVIGLLFIKIFVDRLKKL